MTGPVSIAKIPSFQLVAEWRVAGFEPYTWSDYAAEDPPRAGESAEGWKFRPDTYPAPDELHFIRIPFATAHDPYMSGGDPIAEVNFKLLTGRDNHPFVIGLYGRDQVLLLRSDQGLSVPTFEWLVSLATEYACIDEMAVGAYELELYESAWDQYLGYDVLDAVRTRLDWPDWLDDVADDVLQRFFYDANSETPEPYHADGAHSVHLPCFDDAIEILAGRLGPPVSLTKGA